MYDLFRKELVLDLREAQQSPEGIYFDKSLALEIVKLFYEANGMYVLLTHPHSHEFELEKQRFVYENKPENIFLGSHFRFHPSKKLFEDKTFTTAVNYSDWIGVFLDYSKNAEKRYNLGGNISESEVLSLSEKTIRNLIRTRKQIRYTLEHGFKSLIEESKNRSLSLIEKIALSGVTWINIPDTTGELNSESLKEVLKLIKSYFENKSLGYIPLGMHFHNDLGNSYENTIVAMKSFVKYIDVTPLSLGERNGISGLLKTAIFLNENNLGDYNLEALEEIESIVKKEFFLGENFFERQKPRGENSHKHIAGTHANAILKGVNYKANGGEDIILFNYQSGSSNVKLIFEKNGIRLNDEEAKNISIIAKETSIREKGRVISFEELKEIYEGLKAA